MSVGVIPTGIDSGGEDNLPPSQRAAVYRNGRKPSCHAHRTLTYNQTPVPAEELTPVTVTITGTGQQAETLCLPLDYLRG